MNALAKIPHHLLIGTFAFICFTAPVLSSAKYYEKYDENGNLINQADQGAPSQTMEEKTPLDQNGVPKEEEKPGRPIPKSTIPETRPVSPYLQSNPIPRQRIESSPLKAKTLPNQGLEPKRIPRNQFQSNRLNASQLPRSQLQKSELKSNRLPPKELPRNRLQKNPLR